MRTNGPSQAFLGNVGGLYNNKKSIRKWAKSQRQFLEGASTCFTSPAWMERVHATDNPPVPSLVFQKHIVTPAKKFRHHIEIMVMVAIGVELGFIY